MDNNFQNGDKITKFTKVREFIKSFCKKHKQAFIAVILITGAVLLMIILTLLKEPPKKEIPPVLARLVEAVQVNQRDINMVVVGYGTAEAKLEVDIVPQVSGRIISVNPQFQAGGFIRAEEEILRIDTRDYELAVRQAQAGVADAMVKLDLEKAEAEIAIDEWRQLNPGTEPDSPLVLREPQIRQAEALLESALATLATAQLNLERTSVNMPVDVRIVSEDVDLGEYITAGQRIGHAYGIDAIKIELPLEDKELQWIEIPGPVSNSKDNPVSYQGSKVNVSAEFAGNLRSWTGFVKRTTGRVDPTSRLVYVVVEVPNPYDINNVKTSLLPGTFVKADIHGLTLEDAFAIPINAVHNRNQVWIVNDGQLKVTKIEIVRSDRDYVYTTGALRDGDLVITSMLEAVVDGMKVRIKSDNQRKKQ